MLLTVGGSYVINPLLLAVCIATIVLALKLAKEELYVHFLKCSCGWVLAAWRSCNECCQF